MSVPSAQDEPLNETGLPPAEAGAGHARRDEVETNTWLGRNVAAVRRHVIESFLGSRDRRSGARTLRQTNQKCNIRGVLRANARSWLAIRSVLTSSVSNSTSKKQDPAVPPPGADLGDPPPDAWQQGTAMYSAIQIELHVHTRLIWAMAYERMHRLGMYSLAYYMLFEMH